MYKKVTLLMIIVLISTIACFSQKKKRSPYADYWEQQEKQERFEVLTKDAYSMFRKGELEKSKKKYEEALDIIPDDQRTIARVRDIELLMEKEAKNKEAKKTFQPDTANLQDISRQEQPAISPPETTQESPPNRLDTATGVNTSEKVAQQPKTKPPQPIAKTDITSDNSKPYKNTENYRKYLATIYPEGWTEEEYEEGKKKVTKRVIVEGKSGDEYLKVLHHYGATYYFKNGVSISYATWIAESKKPD